MHVAGGEYALPIGDAKGRQLFDSEGSEDAADSCRARSRRQCGRSARPITIVHWEPRRDNVITSAM